MDGLAQTLARLELFLHTLIYDDVRIHCHTQGKHETRDTREGKYCTERRENAEEEYYVGKKCEVSCNTGALVEEDHIDQHKDEGDEEGNETCANGCGTE